LKIKKVVIKRIEIRKKLIKRKFIFF